MNIGKTTFWIGFLITLGVIILYLFAMIIGIDSFAGWIVSLSFCASIILGAALMIIGRVIERRSGM